MFLYFMELTLQSMLLGIEAQAVVGLRVRKLAEGGPAAHIEACGMVSEKTDAMSEALATFAFGGSMRSVICRLRTHVRANEARLLAA